LFVVSCFAFVTAGRWNDRFSPTALEGVPHLPKPFADPDLAIKDRQPLRWPAAPSCSEEQDFGGGGRNARATSSRSRAVLDDPPAIHPRESPAAAGSAAIIQLAQELSRFAEPTLSQIVAARNTKTKCACAEAVEEETSLWKDEEN
jgi:hypothetical protein